MRISFDIAKKKSIVTFTQNLFNHLHFRKFCLPTYCKDYSSIFKLNYSKFLKKFLYYNSSFCYQLFFIFFFVFLIFGSDSCLAKETNFQKISKKAGSLFFLDSLDGADFIGKNSNEKFLTSKENLVFANRDGEIFEYKYHSDQISKIFDLKKNFNFFNSKSDAKKYKFHSVAIFKFENKYFIAAENYIFVMNANTNEIIWKEESVYGFNPNSFLFHKGNFYFSTFNGRIESRRMDNGNLNWYFENSILRSVKIKNHPVLFMKKNHIFAFFSNGKILKFDPETGAMIDSKNSRDEFNQTNFKEDILKNELISNRDFNQYYLLGFDNLQARQNFLGENLLILTNQNPIIFNINNKKISLSLNQNEKFQNAIYVDNKIFAIYKNKYLVEIDESLNLKYFKMPFEACNLNVKEHFFLSLDGKKADYFQYRVGFSVIEKNDSKYIKIFSPKNKKIFLFDINSKQFIY